METWAHPAFGAARHLERQTDRSSRADDSDRPAPTAADLDVLIVGAGLSGVGAAHYLQTECPWASYAIFEARDAIGGTWDLFRYPGIRSDSDMHTLGYSFRPWDGEKSIADGDSILQYIKDTAAESGIDRHIRFNHRIIGGRLVHAPRRAGTSPPSGRTPARPSTSPPASSSPAAATTATTTATCPTSRAWTTSPARSCTPSTGPRTSTIAGKRIVVIGSGATAVTLVPALARSAAHVTMLQRSPTYIASLPEKSPVAALLRKLLPAKQAGTAAKWFHALLTQAFYQLSRRYPEAGPAHARARASSASCPPGTTSTPTSPPATTRGTSASAPSPTATSSRRSATATASVVTDHIERFTESGHPAHLGRRARGRHHRDRHRARAAVPRRHRTQRGRRARRPGRAGSPTRG